MSKCLITGVAGFIGSHLAEKLIADGIMVVGIDSFTSYYDPALKKQNLAKLLNEPNFTFWEVDLLEVNLSLLLKDIDFCFHLAGEPGVRLSWGHSFQDYLDRNVLTTQVLLEALKESGIQKFVYASSSSVYGTCALPMSEAVLPRPISPYGVTKLAAEQICQAYRENYQIPYVALRYFTVYGPRQRPDMAFSKIIYCLMEEAEFAIYGDGQQTRDFTYVDDIVEATIAAAKSNASGEVINVGGGCQATLFEAISILQKITGKELKIQYLEGQKGDPINTRADLTKASRLLNYQPKVLLEQGLNNQVKWFLRRFSQ